MKRAWFPEHRAHEAGILRTQAREFDEAARGDRVVVAAQDRPQSQPQADALVLGGLLARDRRHDRFVEQDRCVGAEPHAHDLVHERVVEGQLDEHAREHARRVGGARRGEQCIDETPRERCRGQGFEACERLVKAEDAQQRFPAAENRFASSKRASIA